MRARHVSAKAHQFSGVFARPRMFSASPESIRGAKTGNSVPGPVAAAQSVRDTTFRVSSSNGNHTMPEVPLSSNSFCNFHPRFPLVLVRLRVSIGFDAKRAA